MRQSSVVARDAPYWIVFVGLVGMFVAGSMGHLPLFAASLVATLAAFAYIGFSQWTAHAWLPVTVMAGVLSLGLTLVLLYQDADVADGTVLGFHPATAALVYVIWIPSFFTTAVVFAWLAARRERDGQTGPTPEAGADGRAEAQGHVDAGAQEADA